MVTESTHSGEVLFAGAMGDRHIEQIVVNSGQDLAAGTVLGRLLSAGAATAVGSPTGDGVITVGVIGADAVEGVYTLTCMTAASDAGTFNFLAPDGSLIRQITVGGGAAANSHIVITIADGAADFVAGDTWTITVTGGDYEALDVAEDDGAQIAAGVLLDAVDASAADAPGVAVVRDAIVVLSLLAWPSGISAGNKAIALAQLAARGIIAR